MNDKMWMMNAEEEPLIREIWTSPGGSSKVLKSIRYDWLTVVPHQRGRNTTSNSMIGRFQKEPGL